MVMEGQIGGGDVEILEIVDYDCLAYNFPAVDLASHFQWYTGSGSTFSCDDLPSEEQRRSFIEHYLRAYSRKASDDTVPVGEVDAMYAAVERWSLATWLYV